ncbi:hypothetical protein AGMMS49975_22620 [Clostridia bacterium]|nr:hypothetical protein AGMMS49975_22620 [Clostridia bacterium]
MRGMTETITIWHKSRNTSTNKDEWTRQVVPNCSWEADIIRNVSNGTANVASAFTVLIPTTALVAVGDLAAKGERTAEITGIAPFTEAMIKTSLQPLVFTVKAISDLSAGYKRGGHLEVTGV